MKEIYIIWLFFETGFNWFLSWLEKKSRYSRLIQLIIYDERFDRNGRTVTELLLLTREETFAVRIIDLVRHRRRMIVENQLLKDLKPDERPETRWKRRIFQ